MSPSPRKREMFSKDFSTRKLQFSNMPAEVIDVPYQIELAEMMDKANHSGDHSPETARSLLLAQSPSLLQKRVCTTDDVFVVKKFATRLAAKERVVKELVAELSTALQREEALQTKVARLERLGIQATKTNNEEQYRSFPVENSVASQSCSDRNVIQEPTTQLAENSGKDVGHSSPDGALAREQLTAAESRIKLLNSHNLNTASALKGLRDSLRMLKEEFIQAQTANVQLLNNTGSDLERITRDYIKLKLENRHLRNELQELKGNIRVFCRVRPLMSDSDGPGQGVFCPGEEVVIVEGQKNSSMNFVYDKVYGPSVTQEQVFMDVLPLVRSVMEGYNVCIFAYGQTGSGKTYTMLGPHPSKEGAGVIQRSIDLLFNLKNDAVNDWDYKISAEIIEVYNESVRDLLGGLSNSYPRVEQRRLDNTIRGLDSVQVRVESTLEVLHLMEIGSKNRAVGATSMNEHSSRSHCIVIVRVEGQQRFTGEKIFSSLNLIDLAGSERVSRSEATGDRLKETQHINKSLAALGDVMQALLDKRPHIPFRNSKLTQLLQDSLGGSSKVVMLAHVAPERDSQSETVSTLKFASRLLNVELGSAGKNKGGFRQLQAMVVDKDKEVEDLKRQLDDNQKLATFKVDNCKKEVASKKAEAKALAARVAVLEQKNKELEQRLEHGSSFESTLSHLQRHSISLNSSVSSDMLRSDMSMKGRTPRYGESGSLSRIPSVCSTTGDASELSSSEVATPRDVDPTADISAEVLSSSESDLVSIPHRKAQPQVSHQVSRPKDVGASFQQSRKLRIPGILHSSTNGLPVLRASAVSGGMLPVTRVQKFISKRWM